MTLLHHLDGVIKLKANFNFAIFQLAEDVLELLEHTEVNLQTLVNKSKVVDVSVASHVYLLHVPLDARPKSVCE